mmetsp:Transcript_24650/g.37363  ORF Transcript_24650/g.37363 Transcript_24650/m.37363 type:complete len:604 (-) Transcript_24650:64-1875(-)|eukprot:scaffold20884_cov150-Skeletonema_dohrnii-CCMP3373.AAC.9
MITSVNTSLAAFTYLLLLLLAPSTSASFFSSNKDECELYLAPSHLKNAASHGFGLGIFAGKHIHQGEILTDLREILIPLYDSATLDATHPPLREYLWPAVGCVPELAVHTTDRTKAFWFGGGISSMAPCTSKGFNVEISAGGNFAGAPRWNVVEDSDGSVPSREDPHAGSYSYRHGMTYIAARDIAPGEELVVDCTDDNFDHLSLQNYKRINSYKADDGHMCLDNVRIGESQVANAGKGLVAAKSISKDDIVLSSPVVPIHRRDLFGDGTSTGKTASGINNYQLMLNYALGHEDSDLLLLPYGPFVNYINGSGGSAGQKANAVLKWHKTGEKEMEAPRRLQFHHHELFSEYAKAVTETHGKGLVIDIVALDNIGAGEEIFLDYGEAWTKAYEEHVKRYQAPSDASTYRTADQWFHNKKLNPNPEFLKTVEELKTDPYPNNLQTICYYDSDAKIEKVDEATNTSYAVWDDFPSPPHECMRPCNILERYPDPEDEDRMLYTAEMMHFEGEEKYWFCNMRPGKHIARDVDYDGILIVDKAYTHDIFLEQAFRHEIGVPDDFFPREWLRSKVRRRAEQEPTRSDVGDEFRRKKTNVVISRKSPKEEL